MTLSHLSVAKGFTVRLLAGNVMKPRPKSLPRKNMSFFTVGGWVDCKHRKFCGYSSSDILAPMILVTVPN